MRCIEIKLFYGASFVVLNILLNRFLVFKEPVLAKLVLELELVCFSSFMALVWGEGRQEGARTGASRGKGPIGKRLVRIHAR